MIYNWKSYLLKLISSNNMSYNPDLEIQQDIPLKEKLIKKGFWLYFLSFIMAPTGYLIKMMISRTLSVEDIGLFYSVV